MSIHINAQPGQIAPSILLPGDPLRARFIADTLLQDAFCFNDVRGMLGYTGYFAGKRISVMGTGMGMPSLAIYVNELITAYGVKTLIRVGTCGSMQPEVNVGDIVIPITASTNSHANQLTFHGMDFAPSACFPLLVKATEVARQRNTRVHVGGIFSSDTFYTDDPAWWIIWANHGLLAAEMETNALYTLAARYKVEALSILTVSDSLVTNESASPQQRERGFPLMAEIALTIAP